jgi:hypothetical protein
MSYVIRCLGISGIQLHGPSPEGLLLKSYDPEGHDGLGDADWTADPEKAMRFADVSAAMQCLRQVPECRPVRPDGKPNRPLTAYHITFEPGET